MHTGERTPRYHKHMQINLLVGKDFAAVKLFEFYFYARARVCVCVSMCMCVLAHINVYQDVRVVVRGQFSGIRVSSIPRTYWSLGLVASTSTCWAVFLALAVQTCVNYKWHGYSLCHGFERGLLGKCLVNVCCYNFKLCFFSLRVPPDIFLLRLVFPVCFVNEISRGEEDG